MGCGAVPRKASGRLHLLAPALVSMAAPCAGWAAVVEADARHGEIATAVTDMLTREHLSRRPLDGAIARRCIDLFLEELDPCKLYFTQADVDNLCSQGDEVAEELRRGEVDSAFSAFNLLARRIDQRARLVDELLGVEHDFSVDEEFVIDADSRSWARHEADARETWRKQIKFDLLCLKAGRIEGQDAVGRLESRYGRSARRVRETDADGVLEMYLTSLARAFDPHSEYYSDDTLSSFRISIVRPVGVGVGLRSEGGCATIARIFAGGAAELNGRLRVRDKILGVGEGTNGPIEDVVFARIPDVVRLLSGQRGTWVRLEVLSAEDLRPRTVTLRRGSFNMETVRARGRVFEMPL